LISLFLYRNFDLFIAVYTVPNHSWINPAERIMSTLNLSLQSVAFKRDSMSSESKSLFDTVNILNDIHKKAQESNKLEFELKKSIMNIKEILKDQIE